MFPHSTQPHNIITWPRHFSWKDVFYPFIISHLLWIFFSLILCWKHLFLLLLDSLQKQQQFPVLVAQENIQINSREGSVFYSVDPDEGEESLPEHSKKQHWWELPTFIAVKIFWLKFHGENLPLASAQFFLLQPTQAVTEHHKVRNGMILVERRCRAIHHIMAKTPQRLGHIP